MARKSSTKVQAAPTVKMSPKVEAALDLFLTVRSAEQALTQVQAELVRRLTDLAEQVQRLGFTERYPMMAANEAAQRLHNLPENGRLDLLYKYGAELEFRRPQAIAAIEALDPEERAEFDALIVNLR